MEKIHIHKFLKGEYSFMDIFDFFRGNYRYHIYYLPELKWLMRPHIREQIDFRILTMDKECLNSGSCKVCGCRTTHLQMANKSCEGNCYPPILKRKHWDNYKEED